MTTPKQASVMTMSIMIRSYPSALFIYLTPPSRDLTAAEKQSPRSS